MKLKLIIMTLFLGGMWAIEFVNAGSNHALNQWGIVPRTQDGLWGLLFSPFLHGNKEHLMCNSLPLLIMGGMVLLRSVKEFFELNAILMVIGGGLVWLLARPAVHIGASGLVFGYFGYLVAYAWFNKSLWSFVVAGVIVFFYGSIVWGVLPNDPNISWEAHLFGLIAGVIAASFTKKVADKKSRNMSEVL